jgi:hypothetical protein
VIPALLAAPLANPPPDPTFLEPAARGLLILHATVGFTAVLSCTHHAVYSVLSVYGKKRAPQLLRFGWIAPLALSVQVLLGLVLYPTYRVRVRGAHFDREGLQWLSQLFDFKEHAAALAFALMLAAALSGRAFARDGSLDASARARVSRGVAALSCAASALVWCAALIGLYITARHPVGTP